MKKCSKCQTLLSLDHFQKNKSNKDGLQKYCRSCRGVHRQYIVGRTSEEIRQRDRKAQRAYRIRERYGLSEEEYDRLHNETGQCPICGFAGKLDLDHDHLTGRNREFLCPNCNKALGLLKEDPERMERMAAYVRKHEREGIK